LDDSAQEDHLELSKNSYEPEKIRDDLQSKKQGSKVTHGSC
jgi:hypothetical protein